MPESGSLRRKLLAWLLTPLLLLWVVGSVVAYFMAINFANIAYDRALFDSTLSIAKHVRLVNGAVTVELSSTELEILLTDETDKIYHKVADAEGNVITGDSALPAPVGKSASGIPLFHDGAIDGKAIRIASLFLAPRGESRPVLVQVAETLNRRRILAGEILAGMVIPQLVLILLAALAVWLGVGRGLAPLRQLHDQIAIRTHRDLRPVEELNAPREVRPIIHAINELMARLRAALDAQQRFIADAAHQLRTPLAGLKTQINLALNQNDPEQIQLALRQLNAGNERTIRLVNQMLALARMEPGAAKIETLKPLNLNRLARAAAMEWVPQAFKKGIDLGFEGTEEVITILGDELSLKMLLDNLIDNAIRYTPAGGQVTVRVGANGKVLAIEDNGPGIPAAEREQVFERFYRGAHSEYGSGLGLAIVHEIAQLHKARITLEAPSGGKGTVVKVAFPIAAYTPNV